MPRKTVIIFIILLLIGLNLLFVKAEDTVKKDIEISREDFISESFSYIEKDDKIKIKVESDKPVNIYIIAEDDYLDAFGSKDFSDAKSPKEGVTSASFSYKIPDDQDYYLFIYNPNSRRNSEMAKKIAISSQKGGVGKTTTAVNLGAALSLRGFKVLLIDSDSQANLTIALGLSDEIEPSLFNIYFI